MTTNIKVAISPGTVGLVVKQGDKFSLEHLKVMIETAVKLISKSEFIIFHSEQLQTIVTDEDKNILALLPLWIPENILVVQDRIEDEDILAVVLQQEVTE